TSRSAPTWGSFLSNTASDASTAAARSCWKRVRCPHRQAFWSRGSSAPSASVPAEMRSPSFTWDPAICSAAA
ncbi:FeoA domain, partial [Dysosmobacter welbionis]